MLVTCVPSDFTKGANSLVLLKHDERRRDLDKEALIVGSEPGEGRGGLMRRSILLKVSSHSCLRVLRSPLGWNAQHIMHACTQTGAPSRSSNPQSGCLSASPVFMSSGTIPPSEFPAVGFHLSSDWEVRAMLRPGAHCAGHGAAPLRRSSSLPLWVDAEEFFFSLSDWPLLRFTSPHSLRWAVSLKIKATAAAAALR